MSDSYIIRIDLLYAVNEHALFVDEIGDVFWESNGAVSLQLYGDGYMPGSPTRDLVYRIADQRGVLPERVPHHFHRGRDLVCRTFAPCAQNFSEKRRGP